MEITDYKNLYRAARKLDEAVYKNSPKYRSVKYKSNYYGFIFYRSQFELYAPFHHSAKILS